MAIVPRKWPTRNRLIVDDRVRTRRTVIIEEATEKERNGSHYYRIKNLTISSSFSMPEGTAATDRFTFGLWFRHF